MKICYIGNISFPEGYGATRRFFDIFNELRKRGHEIHLVIPELGKHPTLIGAFFRLTWKTKKEYVKDIHVNRVSKQITFFSNIIFTALHVRSIIKKEKIDIIVAHAPSIFAGFPAYIAAKLTKKPFVLDYPDPLFIGSKNLTFFGKTAKKIEKWLPKKADAVFAISNSMYEEILKGRVEESKVHIVYPGVETEKIGKITRRYERFNNNFSITYIGSYWKVEGLRYLIRAIHILKDEIPNIKLFLVGGKPEGLKDMEDVDVLIKKYNVQNYVVQLGFLAHEEIPKILQSSDILCAPQIDNFPNRVAFSTKIAEYLASGSPVITTPVGDLKNILRNEENAMLVEPENAETIAKAIYKLWKDKDLREKIGRNGQKLAEETFDVKKIGKQVEEILIKYAQ